MVVVVARWQVAKEKVAVVMELLAELQVHSRAEPGNESYDIYVDPNDSTRILLYEVYADQRALEAHRKSTHFEGLALNGIVPLLSSRIVEVFESSSNP